MGRHIVSMLGLFWLTAGCAATTSSDLSAPTAPRISDATSGAASETPVEPDLVVEAYSLEDDDRVTCREMLQQASNQIVRRCMTQAGWRTYDRAQEEWARRVLRQMQGSPYR